MYHDIPITKAEVREALAAANILPDFVEVMVNVVVGIANASGGRDDALDATVAKWKALKPLWFSP